MHTPKITAVPYVSRRRLGRSEQFIPNELITVALQYLEISMDVTYRNVVMVMQLGLLYRADR